MTPLGLVFNISDALYHSLSYIFDLFPDFLSLFLPVASPAAAPQPLVMPSASAVETEKLVLAMERSMESSKEPSTIESMLLSASSQEQTPLSRPEEVTIPQE